MKQNTMTSNNRIPEKISTKVVVSAVIIFIGVVILAAGHYLGVTTLFYCGLFITLAGVLMEIIFVIIQRKQ